MTGWQNRLPHVRFAWSAAIVAGLLTYPTAGNARLEPQLAQTGPPLLLAPVERPAPPPPAVETPPAPVPEVAESPLGGIGVEVDTLQAPDPESVGLIDRLQGGFDVDFWRGTPRRLVQRLLPEVRTTRQLATARKLFRQLLLSRVKAPEGDSGGESLLKIRARHLLEMGDVKSAIGLLRAAPAQLNDEELSRMEVEGQFYLNDNAGACANIRRLVQQYDGSYWQQSLAFCHALAQRHARSAMIADLLREHVTEVDPAFFLLIEALAGEPDVIVENLQNPNGLMISMMRAASVKLPPQAARATRPVVLRAVALSPNATLETRLEAAERAEAEGALTSQKLAEIYASVPFEPAELADPASVAERWSARGRALLIRSALEKETAKERAAALTLAWRLSNRNGGHGALLRASIPILMSIQPAPELVGFAGAAGRSLFATGNTERALAWYRLVEGIAKTDRAADAAWSGLWPLAQLAAGEEGEIDRRILAGWQERAVKTDGDAGWKRARLLYSLLDSLGRDVGTTTWRELVGKGSLSAAAPQDPALWHALHAAASDARIGETVLLGLVALGGNDADGPTPLTMNAVIGALRRIGLENEARSLAVEAAVAAGV